MARPKYWDVYRAVRKGAKTFSSTQLKEAWEASQHFDCDNFAVCLAGDVAQRWGVNGVGIVVDTSAGHAYNCLLTCDGGKPDLAMVEPQTDQEDLAGGADWLGFTAGEESE